MQLDCGEAAVFLFFNPYDKVSMGMIEDRVEARR
jgi:hypothetical protein